MIPLQLIIELNASARIQVMNQSTSPKKLGNKMNLENFSPLQTIIQVLDLVAFVFFLLMNKL